MAKYDAVKIENPGAVVPGAMNILLRFAGRKTKPSGTGDDAPVVSFDVLNKGLGGWDLKKYRNQVIYVTEWKKMRAVSVSAEEPK